MAGTKSAATPHLIVKAGASFADVLRELALAGRQMKGLL